MIHPVDQLDFDTVCRRLVRKFMQSRRSLRRIRLEQLFNRRLRLLYLLKSPEYWASKPQANFTNVAFKGLLLLAIQEQNSEPPQAGNTNTTAKRFSNKHWPNKTANVVSTGSTTSRSRSSRRRSKSPSVLAINAPTLSFTRTSARSSFSTLQPFATSTCVVCCDLAHSTLAVRCCQKTCFPPLPLYARGT